MNTWRNIVSVDASLQSMTEWFDPHGDVMSLVLKYPLSTLVCYLPVDLRSCTSFISCCLNESPLQVAAVGS